MELDRSFGRGTWGKSWFSIGFKAFSPWEECGISVNFRPVDAAAAVAIRGPKRPPLVDTAAEGFPWVAAQMWLGRLNLAAAA